MKGLVVAFSCRKAILLGKQSSDEVVGDGCSISCFCYRICCYAKLYLLGSKPCRCLLKTIGPKYERAYSGLPAIP